MTLVPAPTFLGIVRNDPHFPKGDTLMSDQLDLANFTSDRASIPTRYVVKHPVTQKPTDVAILLVGLDSDLAQSCLDAQQVQRIKKLDLTTEGVDAAFDPEESRANLIELLAACTVGWENMVFEGKELPFTKENVKLIYSRVPFIRDQVNRATGNRKLFFEV